MAKNITLLGADYPDVPAVQLPQTGGGTATFYDINVIDSLTSTSATDALSAKQGKVLNDSKLTFKSLGSASAGGSKTLTIANNTRAVIFTMTFDDDLSTAFTVYTTGAGVSYAYKLKASTSLSANGSTANKLIISNSHATRATMIFAIVFEGNISEG